MKITIRRWTDNGIIHECEAETIKDALRDARTAGADLSGANLSRTDLSCANLSGANLSRANLLRAYLSCTDLSGANLSRANLSGANLSGANLSRANLLRAYLSPTAILLAWWGQVSPALCRDLMRLDASAHPDPAAFARWAKGGTCPYNGTTIRRVCDFAENPKHWRAGKPPTIWSLLCRLLAEKGCKWGWDAKGRRLGEDGKPIEAKKGGAR